jgi:Family of unknown function (DUF6402)
MRARKGAFPSTPSRPSPWIGWRRANRRRRPKPPKPTAVERKAQQTEAERQKLLAAQAKKQRQEKPTRSSEAKPAELDAEDHEKLPVFDLQDIPGAMDNIGWPIAAKLARKWFASPKHIYNNDPTSVEPIDDTTITLKWALRFGSVQERFDELMGVEIYSQNAIGNAK